MGIQPPKPGQMTQWIMSRKAKPPAPKPQDPSQEAEAARLRATPGKDPAPTRQDLLKSMADEIQAARKVVSDHLSKEPGKK